MYIYRMRQGGSAAQAATGYFVHKSYIDVETHKKRGETPLLCAVEQTRDLLFDGSLDIA